MSKSFKGLSDKQFETILSLMNWQAPLERRTPRTDLIRIWNSIFYILVHGARWEDLPKVGFFPPSPGGSQSVDYGYKGKGVTLHMLVDRKGHPLSAMNGSAKSDERKNGPSFHQKIKHICLKRHYESSINNDLYGIILLKVDRLFYIPKPFLRQFRVYTCC